MEEKRREIKKFAQLSLCDKPRASACAQARVRYHLNPSKWVQNFRV